MNRESVLQAAPAIGLTSHGMTIFVIRPHKTHLGTEK